MAAQFRLQEWALQIRDYQGRPKEMSVTNWCAQSCLPIFGGGSNECEVCERTSPLPLRDAGPMRSTGLTKR